MYFAAFLLVSGVLQIAGPRSNTQKDGQNPATSESPSTQGPAQKSAYAETLTRKIQEFFADSSEPSRPPGTRPAGAVSQGASPLIPADHLQFLIAILPDPVHTHLALFFDRSIEAIQQGAQAKGYVFDRATMPWKRTPRTEKADSENSRVERAAQRQNESLPGLLIFRRSRPSGASAREKALFVFVVGETPTAGLNKQQFRNALQLIANSSPPNGLPADSKPQLLIMGPTFSGSLNSLQEELQSDQVRKAYAGAVIYSGTVTSSSAMLAFQDKTTGFARFASFQENDDYTRARFLQFVSDRGYKPYEIAVLSEDETVYGSLQPDCWEQKPSEPVPPSSAPLGCTEKDTYWNFDQFVLKLHFPREISYFRSAYQKAANTQQSSSTNSSAFTTLPMDLDESGNDDDSVAPYAVAQTSLSQEAVMLGIVSELQKHHIKFTLLLATDPLDDLFLATYLRRAYAQGQVVITVPDLLFAREAAPGLRGVLSINTYSLIPGLSDRLCRQKESANWHQDRLYVSSGNVGTFNAIVGLLSQEHPQSASPAPVANPADPAARISSSHAGSFLPYAPYAEYGSPGLLGATGQEYCQERPLLWLTILGRDGFWPVVGLSDADLRTKDAQLPLAFFSTQGQPASTLLTASGAYTLLDPHNSPELKVRTPPAWNIAYCLSVMLLVLHAALSLSGNSLADSEARAQFARSSDWRGNVILAIGASALASAFVLVVCARTPFVDWAGFPGLTYALWLPYPLFVAVTIWDFGTLRREPFIATLFAIFVCGMTIFQVGLTWYSYGQMRVYWSTRMLFLSSGVSPILPILLVMGAGYWWMWMSLRGVCLVDLRRPRLPEPADLPPDAHRVSDAEGEELRNTAHPFFFAWQVLIPILVLAGILLTALDHGHPVQTIEGRPFDWGYTVLLGVLVGTFLGCLLKLVRTWLKCRQVLAGLDRLPLRAAFGRMKDLCWHSFWNPGGSSLRETYKVMARATENQTHLLALVENWETSMSDAARRVTRKQIRVAIEARQALVETYARIFPEKQKKALSQKVSTGRASFAARLKDVWERVRPVLRAPFQTIKGFVLQDFKTGCRMNELMRRVETLQKEMARTAGVLIKDVLSPLWVEDPTLTVSTDEAVQKKQLPVFRAMAEEYAALVYVNFLVSVLLRIRTLVICAGGLYVLTVLSLNTYPFEPHPALQTLTVILIVVMAATVGYVYAEIHREVILSRLTSTTPGELGLDFWLKFASAGAIPVFSLLAAQFPSINQFLFSWLEPALQALK